MKIPPIPFSELALLYPKHAQALNHPTMQECARFVRIYTRITGEKPPHVNDAIAFIAKRNAIAEYKMNMRRLYKAAPDLLLALRAALPVLLHHIPDGQIYHDAQTAINKVDGI